MLSPLATLMAVMTPSHSALMLFSIFIAFEDSDRLTSLYLIAYSDLDVEDDTGQRRLDSGTLTCGDAAGSAAGAAGAIG